MPVTPEFKITQDDESVDVIIHVPYVRVSDMEFTVVNTDFHFYCKPYLLKLQLPGNVIDDERARAVYDINDR